jgi:hypothetical protein
MGLQDIMPLDELIGDLGNDHLSLQRARVNSTSASLGEVSPDAICRMYDQDSPVSGSPSVRSGLVIIMDALVLMVKRHDLSPLRPSAFWPLSLFFANTLSMT